CPHDVTTGGAAVHSRDTRAEASITERENPPMCQHQPPCPTADSPDRESARLVAHHPEQGWSLLCNGVVLFEDTGEILPDGRVIAPHRFATAV
ncbi:DUF5999 family protein, partial [Streptomyces chilikensis]